MFRVDFPRVGCGQKIPQDILQQCAKLLGREAVTDASHHLLPAGNGILVSIDKVGRFTTDIDVFTQLAIRHCIGDILAEQGLPIIATACIEAGPEISTPEHLAELTSSLRQSCQIHSLELGNLHSIRSDYTSLTISIVGTRTTPPLVSPPRSGRLYLTGRLGAFKNILINEMDGIGIEEIVAELTQRRIVSWPKPLFAASDVTGFGLSGTLFNVSQRYGISIVAQLSPAVCISEDVFLVRMSCTDSKGGCWEFPETTSDCGKIVMNCTELAGPFVMLCDEVRHQEFEEEFFRLNNFSPIAIGTFDSRTKMGVVLGWTE